MPQLSFLGNYNNLYLSRVAFVVNNGSLSFFPFNILDSISFNTINLIFSNEFDNQTHTISLGLYSLNSSTLSLKNSVSRSFSVQSNDTNKYVILSDTSATQNITPGTWWFGLLVSTGGASGVSLIGGSVDPSNAFPGAFIGGRMTDSTNALPSSIATSVLDITGQIEMAEPYILLTAV